LFRVLGRRGSLRLTGPGPGTWQPQWGPGRRTWQPPGARASAGPAAWPPGPAPSWPAPTEAHSDRLLVAQAGWFKYNESSSKSVVTDSDSNSVELSDLPPGTPGPAARASGLPGTEWLGGPPGRLPGAAAAAAACRRAQAGRSAGGGRWPARRLEIEIH
jgi:hypothetical protein